jgi:ethanolamine permease
VSTRSTSPDAGASTGTDASAATSDYLARRQLRTGAAGWVLLAGLGVSYVISGDYSGWNFGLAEGGFGGLLIAGVVITAMYFAMVLGMAELSSALPAAWGGYTFARRALGPWGGFATGTAILIEYSIAPAAIATFIGVLLRVAEPLRDHRRLVGLPGRLRAVHRGAPDRRRQGAQGDVRDHRERGRLGDRGPQRRRTSARRTGPATRPPRRRWRC